MMSASGAFDVDSDRIVAVGIRDVSMQNGYGPTGGTDHDDVSAGSSLRSHNGHGPTGGTDQGDAPGAF
jgi:hypothetical protein